MRGTAFLHFIKYVAGIEKAQTQTTEAEMNLIRKYAANKSYAVEIGVYEGVNTAVIAKLLQKDAQFFAIDPFFKNKLGICWYKLITYLHLFRNRVFKKVTITEAFSFKAAGLIRDAVDFIFIDGDHTYEGLQKDWSLYSAKIVPGGYVLLHDTSVPHFDPWRANLGSIPFFNEVIIKDKRFMLVETVDSLNIMMRLPD